MKNFAVIQKRISNLNPDHHAIARGMVWIALFVFFGKLAGAAKEMLIAYRYGVSEEVDAYLFVLNLVTWPVGVWFSILTYVLVPLATRIRQDASSEFGSFSAELFGFSLVLGCNLALIFWFGLPILLRSSWLGLSISTVSIATDIIPVMAALAPLEILISLFSALMLSSGRHANTLLESVPALAILVALLILPHDGLSSLVLGTLAGFTLQLVGLTALLGRKGEIEKPRFTTNSAQWTVFWQGFGVLLVGNTLMSFISIIDQFFAAHLGTGAIATISYANRVLALIIGLSATAVSRATLPVFSRKKPQEREQMQRVAMIWVQLMFVFGVFAMLICWWLAPWAIKFLFERGLFTPKDSEAVTEVFRYGVMQFPFYFSFLVMVVLLASRQHHKFIAINASINLVVKIGANYTLVPLMGMNGIIAATVIMHMVAFIVLYWFTTHSYRITCKQ